MSNGTKPEQVWITCISAPTPDLTTAIDSAMVPLGYSRTDGDSWEQDMDGHHQISYSLERR